MNHTCILMQSSIKASSLQTGAMPSGKPSPWLTKPKNPSAPPSCPFSIHGVAAKSPTFSVTPPSFARRKYAENARIGCGKCHVMLALVVLPL